MPAKCHERARSSQSCKTQARVESQRSLPMKPTGAVPGLANAILFIALGTMAAAIFGCNHSSTAPRASISTAHAKAARVLPAATGIDRPIDITAMRNAGPGGLFDLMSDNADTINRMRAGIISLDAEPAASLRSAIDRVARQRDSHASGLYWYTDIEAAKAVAANTGRHILSLRLLGNLDEHYSCANSRFFRTVLYANPEVSRHLRIHYVLHWKSERPAPLVTIDMGDGLRIKRTITGNSIHYVLDADGTVLDALPGLYGPTSFLAALRRSESTSSRDAEALRSWHGRQADGLCRQWLADAVSTEMYPSAFATQFKSGKGNDIIACLAEAFPRRPVQFLTELNDDGSDGRRKPSEFEPVAVSKSMGERPISRQTSPAARYHPVPEPLPAPA